MKHRWLLIDAIWLQSHTVIADTVLFGSTDTATERTSLLQSTCTPHRLSWQWDNRQGKGRNDVITFFLFVMAAEMSEEERGIALSCCF